MRVPHLDSVRVTAARRSDCYQGIADTIVQWLQLHARSVMLPVSQSLQAGV